MIVRILTEGQYNLPGAHIDELNAIDNRLVDVVEQADREQFERLLNSMDLVTREEFDAVKAMAAKALASENKEGFVRLRAKFSSLENFEAETIEAALKALAEELGVKVRDLVMPARLACTGVKVGPSLYDLMTVLGREKVLARFDRALAQMS